jgi:hypothetical protein
MLIGIAATELVGMGREKEGGDVLTLASMSAAKNTTSQRGSAA